MSRSAAFALVVVAGLVVGCGRSAPARHGAIIPAKAAPTSASKTARLVPGGFRVWSGIADRQCDGGRGISLRGPFGWRKLGPGYEEIVTVNAGTLAGNATVVAFSSFSPAKGFAVLDAVSRSCGWDNGFGDGGTARIAIPSGFRTESAPDHAEAGMATGQEGLVIESVLARHGGGAIVAGSYKGAWLVGEVTAHGQLDPTFGRGGWSALPFEGAVTKVRQEPSGRIILAGGEHFSGCCTVNWAAAVSASGQLERSFGTDGRVELPTGESSSVQELLHEPDGEIVVEIGGGNMGCWGTSLALLTPSGRPLPRFAGFAGRIAGKPGRFWEGLGLHAFIGDSYIEGEGFVMLGTGQRPCDEERPGVVVPATGILARFRANGTIAGPVIRFPSRMYGTVSAFPDGQDVVLAEAPYNERANLTLTALRPNGSTDVRFGDRGHARIHTPWEGLGSEDVSIIKASPTELVLVATNQEDNQVEITHVRL